MNKPLDYDFSRLPDVEMEAKPIKVESIPDAIVGGMRTWVTVAILGLCMIAFGVLMVVFGGGK